MTYGLPGRAISLLTATAVPSNNRSSFQKDLCEAASWETQQRVMTDMTLHLGQCQGACKGQHRLVKSVLYRVCANISRLRVLTRVDTGAVNQGVICSSSDPFSLRSLGSVCL